MACTCEGPWRCRSCRETDYARWDVELGKLDDGEQAKQDLHDARQQRPEDSERAA